jgi:phosphoribosylanthranilate isomerase
LTNDAMIDGIRFKVCGLTTLVDAEFADRLGADFLGFILHPASPRHLSLLNYRAMSKRLPEGRKRVAVMVEPSDTDLQAAVDAGFDLFQIHFRTETPLSTVKAWSENVTPARLWLAPKLAPGAPFDSAWLPLAATFLVDTYQPGGFGGSGRTGDWPKFAELRQAHPQRTWILAGGLNPDNIGDALATAGAKVVDVNSGVEAAPGVKDHAKLRAFVLAIHRARTANEPQGGEA